MKKTDQTRKANEIDSSFSKGKSQQLGTFTYTRNSTAMNTIREMKITKNNDGKFISLYSVPLN
jgi:hypothetical protein